MSSYNYYEITAQSSFEDKVIENDLFGFNDIVFKKMSSDVSGFMFLTCTISKDYKDKILILNGDTYSYYEGYRKEGTLDIFIKDNIMFVRGNYIDRMNFDKLINNSLEVINYLGNPTHIGLDLLKAVKDYENFKTLSIKDFSATINKLKTSGQLSSSDEDITTFLNRSTEITATTLIYPYGTTEYDIHVDSSCKIRLKDNDFDSSLNEQLNVLFSFYSDVIINYKRE